MDWELLDVQAGFRKGRGTRDQIANICWIVEKAREFHKNIYFCFTDYAKAFDCVDHNKLWKILKEMGIRNHLTCLLSYLYAHQGATVRTGHGATDWFQIGKGVRQGCIFARSQREELCPWQRSWGRRLGICKGGIEPQETLCSQASTPKTRVCLLYCFMLSLTPLTLWGAVPHHLSQWRS